MRARIGGALHVSSLVAGATTIAAKTFSAAEPCPLRDALPRGRSRSPACGWSPSFRSARSAAFRACARASPSRPSETPSFRISPWTCSFHPPRTNSCICRALWRQRARCTNELGRSFERTFAAGCCAGPRHAPCTGDRSCGVEADARAIERRIFRRKPILVVRTANGWRATRVTRLGCVSAWAATALAAQMALSNRGTAE